MISYQKLDVYPIAIICYTFVVYILSENDYIHLTQFCIRQLAEKKLIRWIYTQKLDYKPEFL